MRFQVTHGKLRTHGREREYVCLGLMPLQAVEQGSAQKYMAIIQLAGEPHVKQIQISQEEVDSHKLVWARTD